MNECYARYIWSMVTNNVQLWVQMFRWHPFKWKTMHHLPWWRTWSHRIKDVFLTAQFGALRPKILVLKPPSRQVNWTWNEDQDIYQKSCKEFYCRREDKAWIRTQGQAAVRERKGDHSQGSSLMDKSITASRQSISSLQRSMEHRVIQVMIFATPTRGMRWSVSMPMVPHGSRWIIWTTKTTTLMSHSRSSQKPFEFSWNLSQPCMSHDNSILMTLCNSQLELQPS